MIIKKLNLLLYLCFFAASPAALLAQDTAKLVFAKDGRLLSSSADKVAKPDEILIKVEDNASGPYKLAIKQYSNTEIIKEHTIPFVKVGDELIAQFKPEPNFKRVEYLLVKENSLENELKKLRDEYSQLLELINTSRILYNNLKDTISKLENTYLELEDLEKQLQSPRLSNRSELLEKYKGATLQLSRLKSDSTALDKVLCSNLPTIDALYNSVNTGYAKVLNELPYKALLSEDTLREFINIYKIANQTKSPLEYVRVQTEVYKKLVAKIYAESVPASKADSISKRYAENSYQLKIRQKLLKIYEAPILKDEHLYKGVIYSRTTATPLLAYDAKFPSWEQTKKDKLIDKEFYYEVMNLNKPDTFRITKRTLKDSTAFSGFLEPVIASINIPGLSGLKNIPALSFYSGLDRAYQKRSIAFVVPHTQCMRSFEKARDSMEDNLMKVAFVSDIYAPIISDTSSNYYSLTSFFPDTFESSTRVTLTLKEKTVPFSYSYEHHKRYFTWAAAGLTYIFGDVSEIRYSKEKGLESVRMSGMHPTAGIKFYPAGTVPLNRKFKPNFHVYAGLDFMRPLKSYQLGIGLDLVSGFALGTGLNFFLLEQQTMVNNEPDEKYTYLYKSDSSPLPPAYFSISIDPSLFIKIFTAK